MKTVRFQSVLVFSDTADEYGIYLKIYKIYLKKGYSGVLKGETPIFPGSTRFSHPQFTTLATCSSCLLSPVSKDSISVFFTQLYYFFHSFQVIALFNPIFELNRKQTFQINISCWRLSYAFRILSSFHTFTFNYTLSINFHTIYPREETLEC